MANRDVNCAIRRTVLLVVSARSCIAFESSICGGTAALAARRDLSGSSIARASAPGVLAPLSNSASHRHPTLGGTRGPFSVGLVHTKRRLCLQSSGQSRCDFVTLLTLHQVMIPMRNKSTGLLILECGKFSYHTLCNTLQFHARPYTNHFAQPRRPFCSFSVNTDSATPSV